MPILADTSVLLAAAVQRETKHKEAVAALQAASQHGIAVPVTILAETLGFAGSRYGLDHQRRLWDALSSSGIEVLPVGDDALAGAREIDKAYADAGFGFADCTLLAVCEEIRCARVLSSDARLRIYRPSFASALEVMP